MSASCRARKQTREVPSIASDEMAIEVGDALGAYHLEMLMADSIEFERQGGSLYRCSVSHGFGSGRTLCEREGQNSSLFR
jgi:hypothetical protein